MIELERGYQFTKDQLAELEELRNENAWLKCSLRGESKELEVLLQQYGELQEAARKVIRYWGIRHESYLKEYVTHMDSVIQKHIREAE